MRASSLKRLVSLVAVVNVGLLVTALQAGTFKNPELITTSYDPVGIATADLDGDGVLDLVYVDGTNPSVAHILRGRGNGTFSHGQDIPLPTAVCGYRSCSINLADVTHDGNIDIIRGGADSSSGKIAVLTGRGDGTFNAPIVTSVTNTGSNGGNPGFNTIMGIGDVNGDGAAVTCPPESSPVEM